MAEDPSALRALLRVGATVGRRGPRRERRRWGRRHCGLGGKGPARWKAGVATTGPFLLRLHGNRYELSTGLKSSLPSKYANSMQSQPSSHLSSWTSPAGCDHTDPGPPVCGAAPLTVCVALPWITTP